MRSVSLLEMKTWARQLSDTENDPNIDDDELAALANRHMSEVFDRLVDSGPPDYYASTTTVTTSDGTIEYPLDVEFRNLVGVYVRESTDMRRAIFPMPNGTRGNFKAPTGEWTLDVEYIPIVTPLEANGDTFDGVSGFEELIVNLMARDIMIKREALDSGGAVMANIARMEARIAARGRNRDKGQPKRVTDLDEVNDRPFPFGWGGTSRIACYRLRADNLELYEAMGGWLP